MLHLDPSKRIPLDRVLEHKWMLTTEAELMAVNSAHQRRFLGSSESLLWNDQVLLAIQRMKYDVEACKQVGSRPRAGGHSSLCKLVIHVRMYLHVQCTMYIQ